MILISQLINDNSRVLQKLLKYFSDRTTSTSYVLPSADVFPVIVILDLHDWESAELLFGSSL